MRLGKAIALRLFYGLISLIFVSFVTFAADELAPGDAATLLAGEKASPARVQAIREREGLNRPFLTRYLDFVGNAAQFKFGNSYFGTRESVSAILGRALSITVKIAFLAMLIAAAIGITLGTLAAVRQTQWPDKTILTVSTLGVTLPNFVLAPILAYFFAIKLNWLPLTWEADMRGPEIFYLILPVLILALRPMASITRLTRASMIETLHQEFIRLATAKGVPPLRLIVRHALRNAILPVVTALGSQFGILLTGSFTIDIAFGIPGVGMATIEAINQRDTPVLLAAVFVTGGMFVLVNMAVDMLLPMLDPRIREAQV